MTFLLRLKRTALAERLNETSCPVGAPRAQPQEALDPSLLWKAHLMLLGTRDQCPSFPPLFLPEPLLVPEGGGRRGHRIPGGLSSSGMSVAPYQDVTVHTV